MVACFKPELEIMRQIEHTRAQMNRLANELGIEHPQVVRCSQNLDRLLLDYYAASDRSRRQTVPVQGR